MITVAAAGAFDPLHVGHLRNLEEARKLGDRLVVLVNQDQDLILKKGYFFMPVAERCEIIKGLRCVDEVRQIIDKDGSCADALAELRPDIFAKGGDRAGPDNMPQSELDVCERLGIKIVYGVGGGKIQSSSELVRAALARVTAP